MRPACIFTASITAVILLAPSVLSVPIIRDFVESSPSDDLVPRGTIASARSDASSFKEHFKLGGLPNLNFKVRGDDDPITDVIEDSLSSRNMIASSRTDFKNLLKGESFPMFGFEDRDDGVSTRDTADAEGGAELVARGTIASERVDTDYFKDHFKLGSFPNLRFGGRDDKGLAKDSVEVQDQPADDLASIPSPRADADSFREHFKLEEFPTLNLKVRDDSV